MREGQGFNSNIRDAFDKPSHTSNMSKQDKCFTLNDYHAPGLLTIVYCWAINYIYLLSYAYKEAIWCEKNIRISYPLVLNL